MKGSMDQPIVEVAIDQELPNSGGLKTPRPVYGVPKGGNPLTAEHPPALHGSRSPIRCLNADDAEHSLLQDAKIAPDDQGEGDGAQTLDDLQARLPLPSAVKLDMPPPPPTTDDLLDKMSFGGVPQVKARDEAR